MNFGASKSLPLVIVSEDWFARSYLTSLAHASGHFASVIGVDDCYSALAEIWDGVARGDSAPVVVIDRHSVAGSADMLLAEVRSDARTAAAFIAHIVPPPGGPKHQVNLVCIGEPGQPEMARLLDALAFHAGRAAPSTLVPTRRRC